MFGISTYLARVIGVNMVLICLLIIVNPDGVRKGMDAIYENHGLRLIFGALSLIVGTILTNLHNLWVFDWPIVITILGWVLFVRGLLRLYFTTAVRTATHRFAHRYSYMGAGVVGLLVGLFLVYHGFFNLD